MHSLIGAKGRREERRGNTEMAPGFSLRSAAALVLKGLSGGKVEGPKVRRKLR